MARGRPSKKQVILDAAQALFAQYGYQTTSIDLVVRHAGVSKPTVYNNFPSKQALLQSLINTSLLDNDERLSEALHNKSNCLSLLYATYLRLIETPFELAILKILYGESHKLDEISKQLCLRFDRQLQTICLKILAPLNLNDEQQTMIIALYKDALLFNTLTDKKRASEQELIHRVNVLGLAIS